MVSKSKSARASTSGSVNTGYTRTEKVLYVLFVLGAIAAVVMIIWQFVKKPPVTVAGAPVGVPVPVPIEVVSDEIPWWIWFIPLILLLALLGLLRFLARRGKVPEWIKKILPERIVEVEGPERRVPGPPGKPYPRDPTDDEIVNNERFQQLLGKRVEKEINDAKKQFRETIEKEIAEKGGEFKAGEQGDIQTKFRSYFTEYLDDAWRTLEKDLKQQFGFKDTAKMRIVFMDAGNKAIDTNLRELSNEGQAEHNRKMLEQKSKNRSPFRG